MPALKNLIGQRFGRLVVISRAPNQGRYVCWNCKCDCGNEKIVRAASLTSGRTQSCGCFYKETRPVAEDLTGQKFGKLTVIEKTELRKDNRPVWKCQCDCGGITLANSHELRQGYRVSCGCRGKSAGESIIETLLQIHQIKYKYNSPYFQDLIMPGYTVGRYDFILFDEEDKPYRLIEYDGEQHFRETPIFKGTLKQRQEYDNIKNKYALDHNIPLVRIPYWEQQNITIDMILGNQFLIKKEE